MRLRASSGSIPVVFGLVRAFLRNTDVVGLLLAELGQLGAKLVQVQPRDGFIELLGKRVHLVLIGSFVGVQFDLRHYLVGEAVAHHKAGVARRAAEVEADALQPAR